MGKEFQLCLSGWLLYLVVKNLLFLTAVLCIMHKFYSGYFYGEYGQDVNQRVGQLDDWTVNAQLFVWLDCIEECVLPAE